MPNITPPKMDPMHHLSYHMNNFLASDESQKMNDEMNKSQFPELHQAIQNQVKVHKMVVRHFAKLGSSAEQSAVGTPGQQPGGSTPPTMPGM